MKWYQPLECDNTVKNPLVCDYDNLEEHGFNGYDFRKGKKIENWKSEITFQAKELIDDGDPDDALQNHLILPIFSKRLIKALGNENIMGIQYLPVKILRPNNDLLEGFAIANITNFISAFDYERSKYNCVRSDFPNPNVRRKIAGVMQFVLLKSKIAHVDIFRLEEYKQCFFVSERFKTLFENNEFTGYSFTEIELT